MIGIETFVKENSYVTPLDRLEGIQLEAAEIEYKVVRLYIRGKSLAAISCAQE